MRVIHMHSICVLNAYYSLIESLRNNNWRGRGAQEFGAWPMSLKAGVRLTRLTALSDASGSLFINFRGVRGGAVRDGEATDGHTQYDRRRTEQRHPAHPRAKFSVRPAG